MAHHHLAPDHSRDETKASEHFKVFSSATATPTVNHSSGEVEKGKEQAPAQEKRKSVFDYQIAGFPWSFVLIASLIAIGVLGILLKTMGVL